jgi:hypothetical protein
METGNSVEFWNIDNVSSMSTPVNRITKPNATSTHRLDSTSNDSPKHSWANVPVHTHNDHTARLSFEWEEVKMEDVQVSAAAY